MRNGVIAIIVIALMLVGAGAGYFVGSSNQRTTTLTSTTTRISTTTVPSTTTVFSTTSLVSTTTVTSTIVQATACSSGTNPSPSVGQFVDDTSAQQQLAKHWVPGWGFRDQLNSNDTDYENFWSDNAGKILMASVITNDSTDAGRALQFIQANMTASGYMPEVWVNSSMLRLPPGDQNQSLSNRIVMLSGENGTQSELQQLSLGDYFAGPRAEGYLGADRIWYNGSAHAALSATVLGTTNGFVKVAYFSFDGLSFYTFLNATISPGDPYVRVSVQVEPFNSTFGAGDHAYLQVFAAAKGDEQQYAFENATLTDPLGNVVGKLGFNGALPQSEGGMVVAYSNRTSTLSEDAVALRFNGTGIDDTEHWYLNGAFEGLTWVGLGYDAPTTNPGELSPPLIVDVYPLQHFDYRLLQDTTRYIATNPRDVAVTPPVSFGFVAEGLALEAKLGGSQTLTGLASTYWNFYYQRYAGTQQSPAYSRAVDVFALAGLELYGGNSAVENFTRDFVSPTPGASIEEYGWAVAALHALDTYTNSPSDLASCQIKVDSFVPGGPYFLGLEGYRLNEDNTFQFAETASGLLIGKVPWNSPTVLWAMDAVFQSNVTGIILNQPNGRDLANTEAIPAYMLAVSLFQNAMNDATGGWLTSLDNANVTSVSYTHGNLSIGVTGDNGSVCIATPGGGTECKSVNGVVTLSFTPGANPTTTSTTIPVVLLEFGSLAAVVVVVTASHPVVRRARSRSPATHRRDLWPY